MPEAEPNSSAHSYEVLGKLAEGGTTEIFLARAKGVGAVERVVVLKRLKRSVTSHVDLVKVFLEEARLASQLQHPNIAQVFEVGKLGGSYFFAMEFVNGETLQSLMHHALTRKIQIPVRAVLTIASALAAGLHHAHDRKGSDGKPLAVVHGEVSPTNTLVSQEGIVKLVDFGVAKAGELGHGRVSPYSSPEQCRGDAFDRRSDLFSLGILLWELLTLDPLYQRASDDEIKLAIEYEVPAKPSAKRYDVPPELDAMVSKLLAKDPSDRFQDADELLASIEALAQKLSILLSTADLSRMMRLWFGTKSEPTVDPDAPDAASSLVVNSEAIPDDLAATHHTPVDDQLDAVRSAAALITARATARAGSTTGRHDNGTVPPELMDNPNENFEQIRDRILARARLKKETKQGLVAGTSSSGTVPPPMAGTGTVPPPMDVAAAATATAATAAPTSTSAAGTSSEVTAPAGSAVGTPILRITPHDRHTRTTAPAPIAVIEDAVRRAAVEAPEHSNGVNGHPSAAAADDPDGKPYEPDKVVVDEELTGSRSASGELGNKGTSGVISRHEAKVSVSSEMTAVEPPREAPPATENVATPEASVEHSEVEARVQAQPATDAASAATDDAASVATPADRSGDEQPAPHEITKAARDLDRERETKAARDLARERETKAARDRDREREVERTERVHATARASTADIARPPRRPAWLLPALGAGALLLVLLLVLKLRGGNETQANPQPTQAQRTQPPHGQNTGASAVVHPGSAARAGSAADPNAEKLAADKLAAEKLAAEKQAAEKLAAEKLAAEKQAAEKLAAEKLAAEKQAAEKQAAEKQAAEKQAAEKQEAEKKAAEKKAAEKLAAEKQAQKQAVDKQPVEKKQPETKKGIEELFAAGDFAKTNTACTKEIVFTPQKLVMCAEAACQTKNVALAKRWINAISKAQRPELIEKCKSLGVELESPPPASPPPASPPPAPPAEAPPASTP